MALPYLEELELGHETSHTLTYNIWRRVNSKNNITFYSQQNIGQNPHICIIYHEKDIHNHLVIKKLSKPNKAGKK